MKRLTTLILIASLIASAAVVGWLVAPQRVTYYTDGQSLREEASRVSPRDVLWEPPTRLGDAINSAGEDYEPRVSLDGTTLFFVRGKPGHNADIWWARMTPMGWSEPSLLHEVNSPSDDLGPMPNHDGTALYFYSDREGGHGGYDLWMAQRNADTWSQPVNLGSHVNTPYNEYGPAITPDGRTLYFASNRPREGDTDPTPAGAWPATIREEFHRRTYDLYAASVTAAGIGQPTPVDELNTPHNEGAPAVSPGGDFLYFASDRPGGAGGYDLYRSRRTNGTHARAENLGPAINTAANELDPTLAWGGFALYFSSDRPRAGSAPDAPREYDLFHSCSREVYIERQMLAAEIDWTAILPWLWWLLVLLLLAILLWLLSRLHSSERYRKLSLLAKCLILSLLAHALILLCLGLWQVGGAIEGMMRRSGGVRVALVSPAGADSIARQIRGEFTHSTLQPASMPIERSILDMPEPMRIESTFAAPPVMARIESVTATPSDASPTMPSRPDASTPPPDVVTALDMPAPAQPTPQSHAESQPQVSADLAAAAPASRPIVNESTASPRAELSPAAPTSLVAAASDRASEVSDSSPTMPSLRAMPAATEPAPAATEIDLRIADAAPREAQPDVESRVPAAAIEASRPDAAFVHAAPPPPSMEAMDRESPAFDASSVVPARTATTNTADAAPAPTRLTLDLSPPVPSASPEIGLALDIPHESAASSAEDAALEIGGTTATPRLQPGMDHAPRAALRPDATIDSAMDVMALVPTEPRTQPTEAVPSPLAAVFDVVPPLDAPSLDLSLSAPAEQSPPEDHFAQRAPEVREAIIERMGGSDETEQAVARALDWLMRHQSDDGRWSSRRFDHACNGCGGHSSVTSDVAVTSLAILAFLGADHTHVKDGPYRDHVARAVDWLLAQQSESGDLRGEETMYSHGIAGIAIAEAYGMTRDPRLRRHVERMVEFTVAARNRRLGGWRYEPGQVGDTSVLGWQVMALASARRAGVDVPEEAFDSARQWLTHVSPATMPGRYSYQPGQPPSLAMTAEAMFVQQLLGRGPDEPMMQRSADYILERLPSWANQANTYAWYYATLALFQHGGPAWTTWNEQLKRELLASQRTQGPAAGSWDPADRWANIGSRVYQTALCALTLEVYYRYLPMYGGQQPQEARP